MADEPTPPPAPAPVIPPGWLPGGAEPAPLVSSYQPMKRPPAPLPAAQTDPAVTSGQALQGSYGARLDAIRNDPNLSDLAKAEAVVAAHEQHGAQLEKLAVDLHERRTARLTYLQAQIPQGPGVPADASPADAAVMTTAFRAALGEARAASPEQRGQMLADALRFGDAPTLRAVLTAAADAGQMKLIDAWAQAAGKTEVLSEIRALREEIEGRGPGRGWAAQAFQAARRPEEVHTLPGLRTAAERQAQQRAQAARLNPTFR
ncbi:hypothetical protein OIE13_17025 [Streptosporangium sp. NBC_01810]|uniref:hypothetical protein n=1 Tax=Streptosporangium sp. NBC_01810 TaxID=2975951 RepID=UPI002DDC7848|nr:hypothetical protein [Streptosporangium sp. NBC_01810]WSA29430.1 hypothetical protein OIE13_17025 [Streptosporangium sp. NBC_01810]